MLLLNTSQEVIAGSINVHVSLDLEGSWNVKLKDTPFKTKSVDISTILSQKGVALKCI